MKKIKLTRGTFALVDDEDFEYLNQFNWQATAREKKYGPSTFYFYAARTTSRETGKMHIYMHREILGLKPGDKTEVDHINHNGIDNQKSNLRVATRSQNMGNQNHHGGTSCFKGVHWIEDRGKWSAQITKDREVFSMGHHESEAAAARAYDEKAFELFGDYSLLNFGPDNPETADDIQMRRDVQRNPRGGSSRFRGVSWEKARCKWVAYINKDKKRISLGRYSTEEDAARAYDVAALDQWGEYASLNFSKD